MNNDFPRLAVGQHSPTLGREVLTGPPEETLRGDSEEMPAFREPGTPPEGYRPALGSMNAATLEKESRVPVYLDAPAISSTPLKAESHLKERLIYVPAAQQRQKALDV